MLFLLMSVVAAVTAWADVSKTVPDVPRFKLFASSHSTAAAEVLAFHGVKEELPQVVLIGGLEGRIYRCDCGKKIDLWDIAAGTRLWAAAEGLKVKTQALVSRGSPSPARGSAQAAAPATAGGPATGTASTAASGGEQNRLTFDHYRQTIDAGQPVILTYSLDTASDKGMDASFRSQERVSVVGIGYGESESGRYILALLPQDASKDKRFEQLMALPGVKTGDKEGLLLVPWDIQTGNLIATFVEVGD